MSERIELPKRVPPVGQVEGKRVVVTGGGRGLGHVIAWSFAHAGAKVALVARTAAELEEVAGELPGDVLVLPGDVRDASFNEAVVSRVVDEWGGLDVWVANAGMSAVGGASNLDPDVWRQVIDVNLTGAFLGARAAAGVMTEGGRIIFTGSVSASRPHKYLAAYAASKAGIEALATSMAHELGERGITVNVVAPGWFDSPMIEAWKRSPRLSQLVFDETALGRWGAVEELAGAYLFLASDAASFITGAVLRVDGGYLLG